MTLDELFRKIKDLETIENFPIPAPELTIEIGTFDAATGVFTFRDDNIRTRTIKEKVQGRHGESQTVTFTEKVAVVHAVKISLQFAIVNRQGNFVVIANDQKVDAAEGQNVVVIAFGAATTDVQFTIRSGPGSFTGEVFVERTAVGAGAFTIPVLPIGIIYAPPQGTLNQNTVDYEAVKSVGVRTQIVNTTQSTVKSSDFSSVKDLAGKVTDIIKQFSTDFLSSESDAPKEAKGIVKGLIDFGSLLGDFLGAGSEDVTNVVTTGDVIGSQLQIEDITDFKLGSEAGLGPGEGDRIIYLKNVRLVWLANGGAATLAFLGAQEQAAFSVRILKNDLTSGAPPVSGLDPDSIKLLLTLDPFTAQFVLDPNALLAPVFFLPPRFQPVPFNDGTFILSGAGTGPAGDQRSVTHKVSQEDQQTRTQTNTQIVDERPGFLSFLGIGPDESKTTENTVVQSASTTRLQNTQVTVSVDFKTQGDEVFKTKAFYDTVFGSIAFQAPLPPPSGSS